MFLNKAQTKWMESVKDERHALDNDDAVSVEVSSEFVSLDEIDDDKGNDIPQDELKLKEAFSSELKSNKKVKAKKKKIKAIVGKKDTKEHKCSTCDLEFKRYSHLSDHYKKLHPGVKHFLCETFNTR